MEGLVLAAALLLAFANGANDNSKGVATLYGSGAVGYRAALGLATVSTALGSLVSVIAAGALVRAFSGKGLVPDAALTPDFLAAVGLSASAVVLLATRVGMPISTTHALVGSLAGAGLVAAGHALDLMALARAFLLPLLVGPLLAIGLAWLLARGARHLDRETGPTLALRAGPEPERGAVELQSLVSAGHFASASLVGFARGLNDTPKILGLVAGLGVVSLSAGALALAAAMALGGWLGARRVAHTLAREITPIRPSEGLAGNLATSILVVGASRLGLPVSTTHVSTGGIFGIGAASGGLRGRMAGEIVAAWLLTLPLSAATAAVLQVALGAVGG